MGPIGTIRSIVGTKAAGSLSYSSFRTLASTQFQTLRVDARVPQNGVAAQARTEQVDLKLRGAARARVYMILADVRLAGRQGRHDFVQMRDLVQRVQLVVVLGIAEQVVAARAADHSPPTVRGDVESGVKLEQPAPAIFRGAVSCLCRRRALLFARVADFVAARFGRGLINRPAVAGQHYAIGLLRHAPAHPTAAEIAQHRLRVAIDRIAKSAAAGNVVDQ